MEQVVETAFSSTGRIQVYQSDPRMCYYAGFVGAESEGAVLLNGLGTIPQVQNGRSTNWFRFRRTVPVKRGITSAPLCYFIDDDPDIREGLCSFSSRWRKSE